MTTRIYTRTGDRGETGLFGGQRVPKDHARVEAYGEVDELNAVLGLAMGQVSAEDMPEVARRLRVLQGDLFVLGANLATPPPEDGGRPSSYIPPLPRERIEEMERWIDAAEDELPPLRSFILPAGTTGAATLHLARTVCRRAERRLISLARGATVDPDCIRFLNRLSDLLFVWARLANHRAGIPDIPWERGTDGKADTTD
ncbi:MAG TPA: cob(I)yrinic acid a,c-diamide adenosyltransferase [Longimicrobiaceae bacterium]